MRRENITEKAICLAKRLKDAGFPQGFEQGDWTYCECTDIEDAPDGYGLECIWSDHPDKDSHIWKESPTDWLLPSLQTCLEWLKQKGFFPELLCRYANDYAIWWRIDGLVIGNTPLEAAYSACLAVLDEGRKEEE